MTWARLDDNFADHPKVIGLSDAAFRLHVRAICYSCRHNTLGEISPAQVRAFNAKPKTVAELADAGLWEGTSRGSWAIHDFEQYNPSRKTATEDVKQKRVVAGRLGGIRSGEARRSKPEANDKANLVVASRSPVPPASYEAVDDPAFRDRYGTLEVAFGGHMDAGLCDEFRVIAEDYSLEEINQAIRDARAARVGKLYPSKLHQFLPMVAKAPVGQNVTAIHERNLELQRIAIERKAKLEVES